MKCVVRRFHPVMLNEVLKIEGESFPAYPYDSAVFLTLYYYNPELFLVAVCEGSVAGYICGFISDSGCGHIASIAVRPDLRGKKIGSSLLETFENEVKRLGYSCVELEVSVDNSIAISFYSRRGYSVIMKIEKYYPDGKDALFMKKLV